MRRLLLWAWLLIFSGVPSRAAEIAVFPADGARPAIVFVSGDFEPGDERKFRNVAMPLDNAIVAFASNGGNLIAGIEIGKAIRLKEFDTLVKAGDRCASACAMAWLGGINRGMADGVIGFHAASINDNGHVQENGAANALIGSYLNRLGLSERAVVYITATAPQSIEWLTVDKAKQFGIDVQILQLPDDTGKSAAMREDTDAVERRFEVFVNRDAVGEDLRRLKGASFAECERECAAAARCEAYTYDRWNALCILKASPRALRIEPRATAGIRRDGRVPPMSATPLLVSRYRGKEFPGHGSKSLSGMSYGGCETACEKQGDCVAFSYFKKRSLCRLFDVAGEYQSNAAVDSGVKSQAGH